MAPIDCMVFTGYWQTETGRQLIDKVLVYRSQNSHTQKRRKYEAEAFVSLFMFFHIIYVTLLVIHRHTVYENAGCLWFSPNPAIHGLTKKKKSHTASSIFSGSDDPYTSACDYFHSVCSLYPTSPSPGVKRTYTGWDECESVGERGEEQGLFPQAWLMVLHFQQRPLQQGTAP